MYLFTYIYHKFMINYDKCPMEHMGMNEKQHKLVNKKSHQRISPAFPGMRCTKGKYWDNCLLPFLSKAFIARIFRTQRRLGTVPTDKMGGRCTKDFAETPSPPKRVPIKPEGMVNRTPFRNHLSSRLYLEKKGIACGWKHFFSNPPCLWERGRG